MLTGTQILQILIVVMAGNPDTETGQKFRNTDKLANRADTDNLGDIIGGNAEWFKAIIKILTPRETARWEEKVKSQ